MQKDNLQRPFKGLHTDNSIHDQPKDTYRFALNSVNETELGDSNFISNEESNEICATLKPGYIPIGKVYTVDNEVVIFSVSQDDTISEIGILDNACNYITHVNDATSSESEKLNFKVANQIDAVYRLRRGCERTIYFTDNLNKPRYFNFDKPEQFQNSSGNWNAVQFSLFKIYNSIPIFENIEIEESGALPPGSYNVSIQYLDEDLNPTEWITTSETILIYNDNLSKNFRDIRGSTALQTSYQNFGVTNKSIKLTLSNLDRTFPFYRVAIIESNNGSGQVSGVRVSQEISTEINVYNYTGESIAETSITEEEILTFNAIVEQADSIEQIENRLILGNTKGKQINFCKLQKYASRIKADLTTKEIILNSLTESNPKSGTVHFDGTGYMPGEMYSFGIVYIFEDNTLSPVYHIPGKNSSTIGQVFSPGQNVRPMEIDNTLQDTFYTDNSNCLNFWGIDSEGESLENQPVRHHKFPLRSNVNLPLFEEQIGQESINLEELVIDISGVINTGYTEDIISVVVEYEIEGNVSTYETDITVATFDSDNGIQTTVTTSSNPITVLNIYENNVLISGTSGTTDLAYSTSIQPASLNIDDKVFTSSIFGIKFSGIDLPDDVDTGGEKVIGYYIVRNERTEDNKTILDTGVLAPMLDETADNGYFVAHGHIFPQVDPNSSKIKNDVAALIHPEHRFGAREYKQTTQLIKEGVFNLKGEQSVSSVRTQDVMAGTSYDPDTSKRRERDSDGFDLHTVTRDNEVEYVNLQAQDFNSADSIDEVFYLDALFSKTIEDSGGSRKEIFNVSGDNKIGAVSFKFPFNKSEVTDSLPYVIMKRNLSNAYANFRILDYYKESPNPVNFIVDGNGDVLSGNETNVFNGDTYIAPMRYFNSLFYDVRLRKRARKSGFIRFLTSVVAVIAGIVLIATGVGVAAGIAAIGYGISQFAAGLKVEQINKVYSELYDAGLRNAVNDGTTDAIFGPNPPDDEVQWMGEAVTNLWFESTANVGLRQGATIGIPDFLDAPAVKANPGNFNEQTFTYPWGQTLSFVQSSESAQNELDEYIIEKLTTLDSENDNGRLYQGFANAELYEINLDYRRRNKQKVFTHLGIEYDCCSDCLEEFPHRVHYSEQSFQEELTDNYRVFLPNNYRDIEGETGEITDLFKISNRLFIHTREGLWELPKNYQERVTDQIVSFIGTGSYFEIPPQKLVDDETGSSAGNQHKWGTIKTPFGVFFVCENQRKIYKFDGRQLKAISNIGQSNWFKENAGLEINKQYYESNGKIYPYDDNPSNLFGSGYISTYDTKKERVIFTKKDLTLSSDIINNVDFEICVQNGEIVLFENFNQTIADQAVQDFNYVGIEDCRMRFEKTIIETVQEEREVITTVSNTADIWVMLDMSGSFGANDRQNIIDAVNDWETSFSSANPDWNGNLYIYQNPSASASEDWIKCLEYITQQPEYSGVNLNTLDLIVISFVNENGDPNFGRTYHATDLVTTINGPYTEYVEDRNIFINLHNQLNSFIGITYPIVRAGTDATAGWSRGFLQHSLAALKGTSYTASETNLIPRNTGFTDPQWEILKSSLQGINPYSDMGLEDFGWVGQWNRTGDNDGNVIDSVQFQIDIEQILQGITSTETVLVDVQTFSTEISYVDGIIVSEPIDLNTSWTKSFSLKSDSWVSWHSYMPNFYINVPEKFYSWRHSDDNIWRHNIIGSYQTFYNNYYPHIIEYISLSNPIVTRLWNHIKLLTEAKKYDLETNQYSDERFTTFNKLVLSNTRQCSGLINLAVKDLQNSQQDYLLNQIINSNDNTFIIDRNERDWTLNDLRDIRIDYTKPIWDSNINSLQNEYFIDKILNTDTLDITKDWTQLESFRDKYLAVRLIFDNFANIKLITNYSVDNEQQSFR